MGLRRLPIRRLPVAITLRPSFCSYNRHRWRLRGIALCRIYHVIRGWIRSGQQRRFSRSRHGGLAFRSICKRERVGERIDRQRCQCARHARGSAAREQAVAANHHASVFSAEALLAHPRAALARALAMRGAPLSSMDLTQSLAIASLHSAAGVQNTGTFWEVSSAPRSHNTAHKGSRQHATRVPPSATSGRTGPTQQK